jgi:hypothetical protein
MNARCNWAFIQFIIVFENNYILRKCPTQLGVEEHGRD